MKRTITRTAVILLAIILGSAALGFQHPAALAASGADLTVDSITLSPNEPTLGDAITIIAAIKNRGDARAEASFTTCYVDDTVLETKPTTSIEPGIIATVTFSWIATSGAHVIKIIADAGSSVTETDESNNSGTYSFTTAAMDLTIQTITWQPQTPNPGDTIVISIFIKNMGNITSRYSQVNLYIDGGARGPQDFNGIEPGKTITKNYNWTVLEGNHTFRAVVDESDNNKESNENNNENTIEFGTLPPDLTVSAITWSPASPSKDDVVSFDATVTNIGAGRAGQSYLGYYIDDVFLGMIPTPELNTGASCNITFSWKATLDAHDVKATADYYSMIAESNEDNNTLSASLVSLPPDLIISNVKWTPENPAAGDMMTFTIYIKNQGGGRSEPSHLSLNTGTSSPILLNVPSIEAGTETSVTTTKEAVSGTYNMWLVIDYDYKVKESNENNNSYNTNFSVIPPDLTITKISCDPEKPVVGDTVKFTTTIKNLGKGKAGSFDIYYFIDDVSIAMQPASPIAGEATANANWTYQVKGGRHILKVVIDYNNNLMESDKKNNTATFTIAPNMPDLAITNVTWSPAEIPVGKDTIFTIVVENLGGLTASPSRLVYYVDGAIAGFNDIPAIPDGEKTSQTFKWAAAEGQHSITITADSKDQIAEIDENNNTVTVKIPPPDLHVTSITVSPQNAASGDKTTVTASIINNRGSKTSDSISECYVDDKSIGRKALAGLDAGQTGEVTFEWIAEPGLHTFKVIADIEKSVMETDETNNEASVTYTTATPDLAVGNIRWTSDSQVNNKEVTFTITINNTGSDASGPFSLQYSFDNGQATVKDMPSIPGGGSSDFTTVPILSDGTHSLKILLDTKNEVEELNKDNNQRTYNFSTVTPDLTVRSITWAPMTANAGDNITITAKIENIGLSKAENVRVSLIIDGIQAGTTNVAEIAEGSTASVDFSWQSQEGEHNIEINADSSQTINESNEANNIKSRTITFTKPEPPAKKTPIIKLSAKNNKGLLDEYWWALVLIGVGLGLGIIYTSIRNIRKK